MQSEKQQLSVSVRNLVEYYNRSGDLDMYTYSSTSRMRAGQRAHQKLQNRLPDGYETEVFLSYTYQDEEFDLVIRGRIDCLLRQETETRLEEIKTITRNPDQIAESSFDNWWGQVKVYAAILVEQEDLSEATVQLTLYHLETKEEHKLEQKCGQEELRDFLKQLIVHYLDWARKMAAWQRVRNRSLEDFTFPFAEYRMGQREMAVKVYQTIRDESQLLGEAPTGIGKTIAAMFPSLKAIGSGLLDRIFYLTARTTGKIIALGTAKLMLDRGLQAKFVVLTAKDKICFNPEQACHPEECQYARGYYDRLGGAIEEIFPKLLYNRETIEAVSRKHNICPFEFSLMISLWSDCIVADYNYAFDPRIYLRRFFEEKNERYVFLIDEAHNLMDRSREMFSFELEKGNILALRREIKGHLPGLYKKLGEINKLFLEKRKELEYDEVQEEEKPVFLEKPLRQFQKAADKWLAQNIQTGFRSSFLELYFEINSFISCLENFDGCYRTLWKKDKSDLRVRLYCLDPASRLSECLERCNSALHSFISRYSAARSLWRNWLGLQHPSTSTCK